MISIVLAFLAGATATPQRAFVVTGTGDSAFLVNTKTGQSQKLNLGADAKEVSEISVSADGKELVFTRRGTPYAGKLYRAASSNAVVWTEFSTSAGYVGDPVFFDNLTHVLVAHAYGANNAPLNHEPMRYSQVFVCDLPSKKFTGITDEPGCHYSPVWANNWIFYIHAKCDHVNYGIEMVRPDGTSRTVLASIVGEVNELDVAPDGQTVVFVVNYEKKQKIAWLDVNSGSMRAVEHPLKQNLIWPRLGTRGQVFFVESGELMVVERN